MTFQAVNIQGAVKEPSAFEMNGWWFQAEQAKEFIPLLPVNPVDTFLEYDQKKDPSCVVFSAWGMITRNSGLTFTEEELTEMWKEYQGNLGGSIFKTTTQIWQRLMLEHFPVDMKSPEFEILLDKNWTVQISIWTDWDFYKDAVDNGILNEVHKIPWVDQEIYKHAIIIYRKNSRTWLQNTWTKWTINNVYDITDVYKEMINNGLIRPCGMICIPFSQDRAAWMLLSMKWMMRALKRTWSDLTGDIWAKYKKNVAKIDWKIDPEYRIR